MTAESRLFEERIDELHQIIDSHLERGSLDEGNATSFDVIIEAWLKDELARLDGAVTEWADREMALRTASAAALADSRAEREHRRMRESSADQRWQQITEAHQSARQAVFAERRARLEERRTAAALRVAHARSDLNLARSLLLGGQETRCDAPSGLAEEGQLRGVDDSVE